MAHINMKLIILVLSSWSFKSSDGQVTSTTVKTYLTDIQNNYNKLIFPKYETSGQVQVKIGLQLISINGFDEVSGILELVAKLKISWYDENLARLFTPAYSAITEILLRQDEVWLPTITVYNSVESLKMVGDSSYHVRVLPAIGWVQWVPGVITKTSCSVDATFFPFDKQKCDITLTSWGYNESEVSLYSRDTVVDTSLFTQNEQWVLSESKVYTSTNGGNSFLSFQVGLERQPMWFLLNMVLPIILLGLLTGLVFLMPVDCGERIGYIITTFLTFAFFLDMINSNLPHTSNPMASVAYFLTVLLYLSSASIIVTIATMRIYSKENEVPNWVKILIATLMMRYCFPKAILTEEEKAGYAPPELKFGNKKAKIKRKYYRPTEGITYRLVGLALDIFFFMGFVLINMIATGVFLVPLATSS